MRTELPITPAYEAVKKIVQATRNPEYFEMCERALDMADDEIPVDELQLVKDFHQFNNVPDRSNEIATALTVDRTHFRLGLILEEFLETCAAAGFQLCMVQKESESFKGYVESKVYLGKVEGAGFDVAEVMDGLSDIKYVCNGMALEIGGNSEWVFLETHLANLTKPDVDGKPIVNMCNHDCCVGYKQLDQCDESKHMIDPSLPPGKVLKGSNYVKANVALILYGKDD